MINSFSIFDMSFVSTIVDSLLVSNVTAVSMIVDSLFAFYVADVGLIVSFICLALFLSFSASFLSA